MRRAVMTAMMAKRGPKQPAVAAPRKRNWATLVRQPEEQSPKTATTSLPSLVVPVGFQSDGMPAAMQLVGRPFAEALLLNAAHLYQRAAGWHEKAPPPPK